MESQANSWHLVAELLCRVSEGACDGLDLAGSQTPTQQHSTASSSGEEETGRTVMGGGCVSLRQGDCVAVTVTEKTGPIRRKLYHQLNI